MLLTMNKPLFAKKCNLFFGFILIVFQKETTADCHSVQYAELGSRWIPECSFPFELISVYWYESVTSESNTDAIDYKILGVGDALFVGIRYKSDLYDMQPNGLLVIPHVTTENERTYKVVLSEAGLGLHEYEFELKVLDLNTQVNCESLQYASIGSKWIAKCSFPIGFTSVYWYDSVTSGSNNDPILRYENLEGGDAIASGEGYKNGQYGIVPNGSLVIPYVTTEYEGFYKVVVIDAAFRLFECDIELKATDTRTKCEPFQYAKLQRKWIAECSFPLEFTSVYWYQSVTLQPSTALILRYEKFESDDAVVSGEGYESGHYGILPNGSLVIPNVTIGNEGTYRVVVIDSQFVAHECEFDLKTSDLENSTVCETLQYAELGSKWISVCAFPIEFNSIYWYDSITSESNTDPILRYERGVDGFVASGAGYRNGLYDIQPDGSLKIPNVTIENERIYKAIVLDKSYTLFEYEIELKTKVSPRQTFPRVNGCEDSTCLITYQPGLILGCRFNHLRPPANLTWYLKKGDEERRIDVPQITFPDGSVTYTSSISIDINQLNMPPLMELFCRVSGIHSTSSLLDTYILIDNSVNLWEEHNPSSTIEQYVYLSKPTILSCTGETKPLSFIWKRFKDHQSTVLAFSGRNKDRVYATANQKINVSQTGQLAIDQCDFTCKGHFMCIYTDGKVFNTTLYKIEVLSGPSPPYLIFEGCPQGLQSCNLHFTSSDDPQHLTCSIKNVHPEQFLYFRSDPSLEITIVNYQRKIGAKNKNTFDISLHGELRLLEPSGYNSVHIVSCIASGPALSSFTPHKTIEVTYDTGQSSQSPSSTEGEASNSAVVVRPAKLVTALTFIATIFAIYSLYINF